MTVTAQEIVAEALSWVGTPFAHQQSIKGVSADCAGYIGGVSANTGATPDVRFETNYRKREDGTQMLIELVRYLEPVEHLNGRGEVTLEHAKLADILALHDGKTKDAPRHLAFLTQLVDDRGRDYPKMCHATAHGVRAHRIDLAFRNRIHSIWRVPNLIYG